MKTRLITSLYISIILILMFLTRLYTYYIFDAIILLLAIAGAIEIGKALEKIKKANTTMLLAIFPAAIIAGIYFGINFNWVWHQYLLMFLTVFIGFMLISALLTMLFKSTTKKEMVRYKFEASKGKYAVYKAVNTGFVFIYPTIFFISLILLNHFSQLSFVKSAIAVDTIFFEWFICILAVFITVSTDSLAMIFGLLFKGPKLCPQISPKKTISGAIGGLAGGTLAALILYWIFIANPNFAIIINQIGGIWAVLALGFFGSVVCQLGDLCASLIKRKARIKDYGSIFPGHGGVMDRADGLIITSTFILATVIILL